MKSKFKIFRQTLQFIGIFVITLVIFSCKKSLDVPLPGNFIENSTVFSTDAQTATAAIAGLYTSMSQIGSIYTYKSLYPGLSADEVVSILPNSTTDPFSQNALNSNTDAIGQYWVIYNYIYVSNTIIENLNNSKSITPSLKVQLIGEAKFLRAFNYFYLCNLFGDVPLTTTSNYIVNEKLPRAKSSEVYQQIINDLTDAQNSLSASYPVSDRGRVNKWAATALLARVYLYLGRWADAETASTSVINAGIYNLEPNLNNVFLATSNESIWELQTVDTYYNSSDGFTFLPPDSSTPPTYQLQPFLLNAFETGDLRLSVWTTSYNGTVYPYKYKVYSSPTIIENDIPLRLAEQYLIRAESRAEENTNLTGAASDLNLIRNRAGLANTSAASQTALLTAIYHENQIEFFAEWGHRWLDLKRWKLIDQVLDAEKTGWKSYQALYPIPYAEIKLNSQLTQNPGY